MIVITGDSWGVGEWGIENNRYCLTGPGIGQYLSFCNQVVNLSMGAASNTDALTRLEKFLHRFSATCDDTFYWIVTNPGRCIDKEELVQTPDSLENELHRTLLQSLHYAQKIAQQNNIVIGLIGGLCDLQSISTDQFDSLKIVVPSWGTLCDPQYPVSIFWLDQWSEIGTLIKLSQPHLLEEWYWIADQAQKKQNTMSKTFHNRDMHPDRLGHRKLRDYLYPQWSHLF